MNADEYLKAAQRTMGLHTKKEERMLNATLGLTGESGEVADMIKKCLFHGHDLDRAKLIKELGDIQWYIAQMCTALDIALSEVMQKNIDKLLIRYPIDEGFSYERSINRAD